MLLLLGTGYRESCEPSRIAGSEVQLKIAYLILTHRNPRLLKRTVQALSSDDCSFFIHIDKKSDIADFSEICGDNVSFTSKRVPVYWGEYSVVRAILLLIQQALESSEHYDYLVLLSGSEYPLRSRRYIHAYLEANRGIEFMTLGKVPAPGKPLARFTTLRYESDKPVRRFASRALAKVGLAQRDLGKHLGRLEPYSGRCWWALSESASRFLMEFVVRHQEIEKFFENTFAPDENFLQTILGNSEFGPRAQGNLHYEDWSVPAPHPATIDDRHIAHFRSREQVFDGGLSAGPVESLFARKFSDENLHILDAIDEMIAEKEGH
jgi:hypothetical protein